MAKRYLLKKKNLKSKPALKEFEKRAGAWYILLDIRTRFLSLNDSLGSCRAMLIVSLPQHQHTSFLDPDVLDRIALSFSFFKVP